MSLFVKYLDAPEGVRETMVLSAEGGNAFSSAQELAGGVDDVAWATLEPGVWCLDGTRKLINGEAEPGWWSAVRSGEDGSFSDPPAVTVVLPAPCSATGVTFTFSPGTRQWCSRLRAEWYNGDTLLHSGEYTPDSPRWILKQTVESLDKLVLELLETNSPGQFAKLQQLEIGQTIDFLGEEILSVQLVNETDPSLCVLSADTMTIDLIDRQGRNLVLQENQRLELFRDRKLKAVQYIVSGTREGLNRYTFKCQSAIGRLEDTFLGGMYEQTPLETLAADILGQWEFQLDGAFADTRVSGYLPVCTQREALQQLAFAIGAVITTQDSGKIRFLPLSRELAGGFSAGDIFQGASITTEPRIARVEVVAHDYTAGEEEVTLMDGETVSGQEVLVTFDEPHHSYTLEGGTIVDQGANWVTITAEGAVTLKAKSYIHTTQRYIRRNSQAIAREQGNYLAVEEVTLVHSANVTKALERLYAYCLLRQTLEQEAVITDQRAGSYVASVSPWGSAIQGFISSMDCTLTQGATIAKLRICGTEASGEVAG